MGNIIIGVMRKAMKDVNIKGYMIPKGWRVFTYFRSVHLDEQLYEEPYKFNPWRWQVRVPFDSLLSLVPVKFNHFQVYFTKSQTSLLHNKKKNQGLNATKHI